VSADGERIDFRATNMAYDEFSGVVRPHVPF